MPLFGKKKTGPTTKESISKLRETLDMLEKREQFLQKKCEQQVAEAKKFMQQKNKRAALMCLKRKKQYEAQIEKLAGARMTIEQQVMTLEGASVSKEALDAMKMGASSMKTIHKDINIEKVDDTMDEIKEQMDIANEISDAISTPLGGEVYDDDELLGELEDLEQESLDEQLLQVNSSKLPAVPTKGKVDEASFVYDLAPETKQPVKQKKVVDEDAELAALEASMA